MSNNVTIPATGSGDATPVVETLQQASGAQRQAVHVSDMDAAFRSALNILAQVFGIASDAASGRLRVLLDVAGGTQTLGTVTTVGTVSTLTSMSQIGAMPANSMVFDAMYNEWANATLPCIARA